MITEQKFNEIQPLNLPENSEYSFKGGSSLIQFQIPESPTLLLTKTLKLNGKLRLNRSTSTFTTPVFPNNINNKGGGAYAMRLNERVGITGLFENITLSALGSGGQTLESLNKPGSLLSVTNPLQNNQANLDGHMCAKDPAIASRELQSAVDCNTEVHFSIPIECGMLKGVDSISLGQNGVRGLEILLQLTSDSNAIICSEADKNDVFYSLNSLTLSYDLIHFDPDTTAELERQKSGSFEFNSWSHQYNILNSSDSTLTLNLGTKKTLSVITSTIPSSHINNVEKDGFSTNQFKNQTAGNFNTTADLNKFIVGKSGVRLPVDFEVVTQSQAEADRPEVERIELLKESMNVEESARTLLSVNTENGLLTKLDVDGNEVQSLKPTVSVETQAKEIFAIGINEDSLTESGRDFSTGTFTLQLDTDLDGASPNALHTYSLSKHKLVYSPAGIAVSS